MAKGGQTVPDRPTLPDEKTRVLRTRLLVEEVLEYAEAAGVDVYVLYEDGRESFVVTKRNALVKASGREPDFNEMADANADISVVNTGAMSAAGISDESLLHEVDQNNLLKFVEAGPCPACQGSLHEECYDCHGTALGDYISPTLRDLRMPCSTCDGSGSLQCSECYGRGTLGGYRDEGGKWIKPLNHPKPDIEGVLMRQEIVAEQYNDLGVTENLVDQAQHLAGGHNCRCGGRCVR